jgi:Holliday junction resolvase RusA-like endonuclease
VEIDSFTLLIEGQPQGKGRPKFGGGRAWTPKATKLAEGEVVRQWEEAGKPRLPDGCGLRIEIMLYVVRPGGHYKQNGELSAEGHRFPTPYATKPDVDNALKLVMDALNKKAYRDDVRIVSSVVDRLWADWPATKIKLTAT